MFRLFLFSKNLRLSLSNSALRQMKHILMLFKTCHHSEIAILFSKIKKRVHELKVKSFCKSKLGAKTTSIFLFFFSSIPLFFVSRRFGEKASDHHQVFHLSNETLYNIKILSIKLESSHNE